MPCHATVAAANRTSNASTAASAAAAWRSHAESPSPLWRRWRREKAGGGEPGGGEGLLWDITPKCHWYWHWATTSLDLKPRKTNCFVDEDFVGDVKEIVAASTAGTSMEEVPSTVIEKIVWQMHVASA